MLVERLIVPAACFPVSDPYYAMTFKCPSGNIDADNYRLPGSRWPHEAKPSHGSCSAVGGGLNVVNVAAGNAGLGCLLGDPSWHHNCDLATHLCVI